METKTTLKSMIQIFLKELEQEALTTRKMLARVPDDAYNWKPHDKSMNIRTLATHIAELPGWIGMTLTTSELDFASSPYNPVVTNNNQELLAYFEKNLKDGKDHLMKANEEELFETWTLRNGEDIYSTGTKADFIRITYCQIVHHRAQLGVYLRLLNIPIPGSYGPSADDMQF